METRLQVNSRIWMMKNIYDSTHTCENEITITYILYNIQVISMIKNKRKCYVLQISIIDTRIYPKTIIQFIGKFQ